MYIIRGASSTILSWHDSRINFSFLMSSRDRKHFRSKAKQKQALEMPQVFCSCAKKNPTLHDNYKPPQLQAFVIIQEMLRTNPSLRRRRRRRLRFWGESQSSLGITTQPLLPRRIRYQPEARFLKCGGHETRIPHLASPRYCSDIYKDIP